MTLITNALTIGSLLVLSVLFIIKFLRFIRWIKLIQRIPGIKGGYHILHGNLHLVPSDGELRIAYLRQFMDSDPSCRKLMRFWYGPAMPLVHVYHPDVLKPMFKASVARKPHHKGGALQLIKPWVGEGLISTSLDTWSRNRKMITPAFHFNVLRNYCSIFNECADVLIDKIGKETETEPTIDIISPISLCVLEGILRCTLSYEGDVQQISSHPYPAAVTELLEMWTTRVRTIWLWYDIILRLTPFGRRFLDRCKYMHELADTVIRERRATRETEGAFSSRKRDFVDMLMDACDENGVRMSDVEIRDEVNTFLAAGHHTTSTSVPWMLYLMAKHPEYQRRVQKEVDRIFDAKDSHPVHPSWNDLGQMTLLNLCAKESLRLYPPVPALQRELTKDVVLEGYTVPKGTVMVALLNNLHRHPDVWDRPDDFYPERFQVEDGNVLDPYSSIPFAAGPRNCLGQNFAMTELKVIISRLLYKFNFEIDPKAPPITRSGLLLLIAEKGIKLKVTKRERGSKP